MSTDLRLPPWAMPRAGLAIWSLYTGLLWLATGIILTLWPLPALDTTAELALAVLTAATLAAEVFTVDFPDRKRVSGGYIFPLVASAVIAPTAGILAAGAAGLVSGALRGRHARPALFHGPRLALSAAAAAALVQFVFDGLRLELSLGSALQVLLYMAGYTVLAWLLGRLEVAIAEKPAEHASVDLLTNVLMTPLPLALALVYERSSVSGLMFSSLALALLLIVVRAYVNLATLHGELKQAYARLAEQERRLEGALDTNREMSQVVSHDLRGPLTSVMGYAELLRTSLQTATDRDKQLRYLASIEGNSRRILSLADKLVDLHRLEEGQAIELASIDPGAVVRSVTEEAGVRAEEKHVMVDVDVHSGMPEARSSEWMLREIAENLVSNAIKYSRDGGRVVVRVHAEGSDLVLEVEDDGIGMAPEDQKRLFTKFFRSGNEEVRRVPGSGLGLALTRTMVERLGGRVEVWSELGRGSRFSVHLPLAPAVE